MNEKSSPREGLSDPFLDEVHRMKREAWERAGRDMKTLGLHLQEIQKRFKGRLIPVPPKNKRRRPSRGDAA